MTRRSLFNKNRLFLFATAWVLISCPQAVAFLRADGAGRTFELTTVVSVQPPRGGGRLRIWIPYPVDDDHQRVAKFFPSRSPRGTLHREGVYGNRMLYYEVEARDSPVNLTLKWVVERHEVAGPVSAGDVADLFRRPVVDGPLLSPIASIAKREVKDSNSPPDKWRALYDYVYRAITYSKEGEGWGRGDPVWACTNKRGNCTDFHSLLIALGQTQGLAARFDMGLPIPAGVSSGKIPGYHCWAELYDEAGNWIAVDASEAKKIGHRDDFYGHLPADRVLFSRGRNITLDPPQQSGPLNFFIDPYVEVGGMKYDNVVVERSFRKI